MARMFGNVGRARRARRQQSETTAPTPGEKAGVKTGETVVLGGGTVPGQGSEAPTSPEDTQPPA